ncbi:MAG TPA: hypothetical protein VET87_14625 [Rubrivivax sp.]|jgi:hypothetical protein|nr:hypothetical protein [Rubrivivax sp.]
MFLLLLGSATQCLRAQGSATPASAAGIYTCIDDQGRKITADRPIPSCTAKEQRVLNKDGSLRSVFPPTLTVEERAEKDARDRKLAELRATQADAVRRDRNLLARYPNEAPHRKAREAALDTVRSAMLLTELRLRDLAAERRPLLSEAEFYEGRALPAKLRSQIEANDASTAAQRESALTQEAELARVNRFYDAELARLKLLWAGAVPGSLGPIMAQSAPPVASSASNLKSSNLR